MIEQLINTRLMQEEHSEKYYRVSSSNHPHDNGLSKSLNSPG